ncbi:nuclease-related domain-containing protein [Bacillus sp. V59.32b]|uniref:nuclease-related domain-containing protein n=1 Tax=Bacillus sp. V59.32b TaxID=1758642 RepID=UPI000E3BEB6C|nr:nuclease-related domain-containing protein [Bacillus sp. V59.32b]RFU60027.1 NERD domain-containing protein [Bacillus sp. V59.32b]
MIIKERKKPLKIQKLEALLRRLPSNHPKRQKISEELAKSLAGYYGEQSLDHYLSDLSESEYFILHDLRLSDKNERFFQLDSLLISSRFFLILEVKNIS